MGIWQNFPVKLEGQRHLSFWMHTPPFLHNNGHKTGEKYTEKTYINIIEL